MNEISDNEILSIVSSVTGTMKRIEHTVNSSCAQNNFIVARREFHTWEGFNHFDEFLFILQQFGKNSIRDAIYLWEIMLSDMCWRKIKTGLLRRFRIKVCNSTSDDCLHVQYHRLFNSSHEDWWKLNRSFRKILKFQLWKLSFIMMVNLHQSSIATSW